MDPTTPFAIPEKYSYQTGLGNYLATESIPGSIPQANNSPQKPAHGLLTERISNTSFTAPRHQTLQTWIYRISSSLDHGTFVPHGDQPQKAETFTPNSYIWPSFALPENADWTSQTLLAQNGDPMTKSGLSVWVFDLENDMPERTAFTSLDGDSLIVLQSGALDIQTELGHLLVRQNEICVIPRAIKYRVTLPVVGDAKTHAKGYICELHQSHFQLPDLGIVGSTGLANIRDFQIPTAASSAKLVNGVATLEEANDEWTLLSRQNRQLWRSTHPSTPFDVVAWHGTVYPYKYDLARFSTLANARFDEHDPSLYVVLTAPTNGDPGSAVVDFAVIPPRWQVAPNTLWVPYFHRNCMSEFFGPIIHAQAPKHPANVAARAGAWVPFGAGVNPPMKSHGSDRAELEKVRNESTAPKVLGLEGISVFLLETERPLFFTKDFEADGTINYKAEKPRRGSRI